MSSKADSAVTLSPTDVAAFQAWVLSDYQRYSRQHLPWRQNYESYRILVSEIMLQQTQVERVIPKFEAFIGQFPTFKQLAAAPTAEVITAWQGLGYNRRGLNLQRAAQKVMAEFGGQLPESETELQSLPGIGPYTAAAVRAFAFNQPGVVIETNIRAVYLHHFFHGQEAVPDQDLRPWIAATLPTTQPRKWYSALMDYGTYLKQVLPNPSRSSRHYSQQSQFKGSNREVRGGILKVLTRLGPITEPQLKTKLPFETYRIETALNQLVAEGFVSYNAKKLKLGQ